MKLKNVKTFESFSNESATAFYRGDFEKAKKFYKEVIEPACVDCNPMGVVDTLVNDEYSDDDDQIQFLHDEFGIDLGKAKEIVAGRDLFMGQMFDTEELSEKDSSFSIRNRPDEERVPNVGKRELSAKLKARLDEIRKMSDGELLKFLSANMNSVALKKLMR